MAKTEKFKKFIVCVLLVISFLLTFTGWVKLKGMSDLINTSQMNSYIENAIDDIADDYDLDDYGFTKKDLLKLTKSLSDFSISVKDVKLFSSYNSLFKMAKQELLSYNGYSEVSVLDSIIQFFAIYKILYFVNILAFVFTLFVVISGRYNKIDWLYTLTIVILFSIFAYLCNSANKYLYSYTSSLVNLKFSITFTSILSLIFALPPRLYYFIFDKFNINKGAEVFDSITSNISSKVGNIDTGNIVSSLKETASKALSSTGGNIWVCPKCGAKNQKLAKFCTTCGNKNPYIMTCPICNKELKNREVFCPDCGTKIEWPPVSIACPGCGAENPLNAKFCEKCGTSLKKKEEPVLEEKNQEEA